MRLSDELTDVRITELDAIYDTRKSFYGKALVVTAKYGSVSLTSLYSYETLIAEIHENDNQPNTYLTDFWDHSATTMRHLHEFLKQFDEDEAIQDIRKIEKEAHHFSEALTEPLSIFKLH